MTQRRDGPVLIEDDDHDEPSPADAPQPPDDALPVEGRAMRTTAILAARKPSVLARWFWRILATCVGFAISVAIWDFVAYLFDRADWLGWASIGLFGLLALICLAILVKELLALSRLSRIDALHREADKIITDADLEGARDLSDRLLALYESREDLSWGRTRLVERRGDVFDADALLGLAERELLSPLDNAARREIEGATRSVAAITAIVPLALADVISAATLNLRMIRRVAEIYGGRGGMLGAWRLTRAVFTHLVATGAVAVGDDLIHSVAGGSVLSRISHRFGEGLVNGALTARVGIATMEVCRPLPFRGETRPSVSGLVRRAVSGLFDKEKAD